MQASGRLIHDIDTALLVEFAGQLDALAFAAGECTQRLTECQVVKSDVTQGLQFAHDVFRHLFGVKKIQGFPDGHVQDIGDRFVVEFVGQHFVLETLAAAYFARHFDLVQVRQVDVDDAQSLTIFASTFRVETEQGRTNLVDFGKSLADLVHDSRIRGGIRAAGNANRRLINHNRVGVLP